MKAATCLLTILAMSLVPECSSRAERSAFNAVAEGDLERARELYASGIDPNYRHDGVTVLMAVSCHAPPAAVEMLLEAGADTEMSSPIGRTPLGFAAHCGNLPNSRLLVEAGADPNGARSPSQRPLALARAAGAREVVELLLEAGAEASVASDGARRSDSGY